MPIRSIDRAVRSCLDDFESEYEKQLDFQTYNIRRLESMIVVHHIAEGMNQ